ncbi:hypothetical protein SAMN06296273_1189 [Nitrosomonas ureae]|uniref:Uncharacterized protein n=1 Tax=Nitrosomonas ureae TaxID=44577 RepID=A0A285BXD9_9PROT|nr:hypothetical protein [Nitrosomonas ureae]SNX59755.1 hypothetical protein SAMN06296273_1189 [Nitrosomonas ureae]
MNTSCPACGSDSIETTNIKQMLPIVYGDPAILDEVLDKCLVCGESGDFSGLNDQRITETIDIAKKKSVNDMLHYLSERGLKMTYVERALELPARTIARWKGGELSAATLALLRIIRTYPWLIEVADSHFDPSVANGKLLEEAGNAIKNAIKSHSGDFIIHYDDSKTKITANVSIKNRPSYDLSNWAINSQLKINSTSMAGGAK